MISSPLKSYGLSWEFCREWENPNLVFLRRLFELERHVVQLIAHYAQLMLVVRVGAKARFQWAAMVPWSSADFR